MKRMLAAVLACTAASALTACSAPEETTNVSAAQGQTGSQPASTVSSGTSAQPAGDGSILIAYFTVPETDGVDTVSSASRVATDSGVVGNTQYIAQAIQQSVGGDLFAIETVQKYPGTHDELLDFAYNELQDNARPELAAQIENPDDYSVSFWAIPTGTATSLCRSTPSWKAMISPGKPSSRSSRMAAAASRAQYQPYRNCSPARRW